MPLAALTEEATDRRPRSDDHGGQRDSVSACLKKVMATSTAADYGQLSLAVLQKASDVAMARVAKN